MFLVWGVSCSLFAFVVVVCLVCSRGAFVDAFLIRYSRDMTATVLSNAALEKKSFLATALETNSSSGHWMPTLISLKFLVFVEVSYDLRSLQSLHTSEIEGYGLRHECMINESHYI